MPQRGSLSFLSTHILGGPYCTFFIVGGGFELGTKLKLRRYDQSPHLGLRRSVGRGNFPCLLSFGESLLPMGCKEKEWNEQKAAASCQTDRHRNVECNGATIIERFFVLLSSSSEIQFRAPEHSAEEIEFGETERSFLVCSATCGLCSRS